MKRTHTCGDLTEKDNEKKVVLQGWVHTRRDHGGVVFIDLRDRYGFTQIVFNPDCADFSSADKLRREDVIEIHGKVRPRPEGMANPNLHTGKIEVVSEKLIIISKSEVPPIEVDDRIIASDELRLKYRYLDLRRPVMQKNLLFRHKVISAARDYFNKHDFLEIETPLLIKSTPEGARDYLVPSRVNPGKFYALPQSPQLYKQILMISGCDRYYQVAKCLRDEDLRADRQPEHTQFDLEMSFVDQKDVQKFVEGLYKQIIKTLLNHEIKEDFQIISYDDAMNKFGSDKPDLRFKLEIQDVSEIVKHSDFGVFKSVVESKGVVRCINPPQDISRNEIDRYIAFCQSIGSKGMAWMRVTETGLESNIAKFFSPEIQKKLIEKMHAKPNSVLMFIADKWKKSAEIAGQLRLKLGSDLKLYDEKEFKFCWVNDFPLFSYNEEEERWEPEHHMFSMPKKEFIDNFEKNPGVVKGDLWDLVLNGVEMGSGSIRVTDPKLQERIMNFIGIDKNAANEKFGFLLDAYKFGGPIHGGMGLGVDRFTAMLLGTNDIREVIAFPKNKSAECPMDGSPSVVDSKTLKEVHLKIDFVQKKEQPKQE